MAKSERYSARGAIGDLEKLLKDAGIRLSRPQQQPAPKPSAAHGFPPVSQCASDDDIFSLAMEGVEQTCWKHRPPDSLPKAAPVAAPDSGSTERRLMEAAVEGTPALTVSDHPEYIEGWVGVAGRRFLPNLRNGLYSIQGQIDLHGLSREEARTAVEAFVNQMSRFRSCCVKIIHGRGINSSNDRAVLKESLQRWLSTRRMSRHVVAYASAPLKDGGVGAVYVLLRHSK